MKEVKTNIEVGSGGRRRCRNRLALAVVVVVAGITAAMILDFVIVLW